MAFDGIVLNAVVCELRAKLLNGKLNKIFEPTKNEIILGFYSSGENLALLVNVNPEYARFHCTTYSKPNPIQAPNFCMLLRKHLMGAKLIQINTFGLERVIELCFETYNDLNDKVIKKLVVQIMSGYSNIILVNSNNMIIDSLKHVSNGITEILPAREYELPKSSKRSFAELKNYNEFEGVVLNSDDPIDKILSENFIGISRKFIQCIVKENSLSLHPTGSELEIIYNRIKYTLEHISDIILKDEDDDYSISIGTNKSSLSVNYFLDDYYMKKENITSFKHLRNHLLSLISVQLKKYLKRLENINSKLNECSDMEKYRIYGELITSNLYKYNSNENMSEVTLENYYDEQKEITIPLDKKYSISKNAERFFKKYNKLKNTLQIVSLQKKETEIELEYIQSILFSIENSTEISELQDINDEIEESKIIGKPNIMPYKKKHEPNRRSTPIELNINNFTVLVGKNNKQNDLLTLKIANKQDLWFHVQKIQGSHVVLKTEGKVVPDEVILKCAQIAMQNSKAKDSTNVPVDYCIVKNVKKPSGAKPRNGSLYRL